MITLAKKIKEIEKEKKLKDEACKISIKEGSAYSISEGFGFRYITPYALALGANNTHIGLLSSIPSLIGSFSGLHGLGLMKETSRKKIVTTGVLLQALMWFALIGIGVLFFVFKMNSGTAPILVIVTYTLLVVVGAITGPAWNSWMKDIIPERFGSYFGARNRIVGFVALITMLMAGFILDYFKKTNLFIGFTILFFIAFLGRSISAYLFTKQYDPPFKAENHSNITFLSFLKKIRNNNFGKFTLYISLMSLSVAIASPFFAVYMLKNLNFTYMMYTAVAMTSVIVRLLLLPVWGRFADKYGNLRLMRITGVIIPIVPIYWLVIPFIADFNFVYVLPYIICMETISGFAWAGFDTGSANFIFDSSNRENMPMFTAYYSIIVNVGTFIGALFGGVLASMSFVIFGMIPILFVFLLSGIARMIVSFIMLPKLNEVRKVETFDSSEIRRTIFHLTPHDILRMLR